MSKSFWLKFTSIFNASSSFFAPSLSGVAGPSTCRWCWCPCPLLGPCKAESVPLWENHEPLHGRSPLRCPCGSGWSPTLLRRWFATRDRPQAPFLHQIQIYLSIKVNASYLWWKQGLNQGQLSLEAVYSRAPVEICASLESHMSVNMAALHNNSAVRKIIRTIKEMTLAGKPLAPALVSHNETP